MGSTQAVLPAGTIAFHPEAPETALVIERGLVRVYWTVPDGRQATVAFIHRNEMVGGTQVLKRPAWFFVQVVSESTLTTLNLKVFRDLAAREVEVMGAIAAQQAERVLNAFRLIAVRSMGNIRERLAYDLLERACQSQLVVGRLEATTTHAGLADSIGSSREVVSRALRDLRAAGMVETAPGVVRVTDPVRLCAIVRDYVI